MRKIFVVAGLLSALTVSVVPAAAQTQRVVETPTQTVSTVLQNAATANGVGTSMDVSGYSVVIYMVDCASCSGGTGVMFEGSMDNSGTATHWTFLNGHRINGDSIVSTFTTTAGITIWQIPLNGMRYVRAEITGYSAGTVTVTAYASMASPNAVMNPAPVTNSNFTYLGVLAGWDILALGAIPAASVWPATGEMPVTGAGLDNAPLTSVVSVGGVVDDTSTTVVDEGSVGWARMTTNRAFHVNFRNASGTEIGTSGAPVRTDPTGTTTQPVSGTITANIGTSGSLVLDATLTGRLPAGGSPADNESNTNTNLSRIGGFTFVFDGSTWDRWTGAVSQAGTWNLTNISGTVSLPTGASTLAEQQTQTTALQLIDNLPNTLGSATSGQSGVLALGAVTTAAPSYVNGQSNALSLTTAGALRTDASATTQPVSGTVTANAGSGTFTVGGTVTANAGTDLNTSALALDVTLTGRLPAGASPADNESNTNTSLSRVGGFTFVFDGSTWDRWTGAVSQSGTWNLNNVSGTVSLPTGASTLVEQQTQTASLSVLDDWDETDRAKVNPIAGQAGVQGGSGIVTALTQRVVLATDVALPAGTNNIGDVDVLSVPADPFGANADASSATGSISAKLRYIAAALGSDPCAQTAKTYVPFSIASATTTQLIAASASNYAHLCSLNIVVGGANNVALVEDDTAACASPTAGMSGGTTAATGWNFAANGGFTFGSGQGTVFKTAATNRYVCLITSGTAQTSGTISYVIVP